LTGFPPGITLAMKLPEPRGPVSAALITALGLDPHDLTIACAEVADDDLHLALFVLYELNYRGWDGVDDRWEWHPDLIRLRGGLEERFESALRVLVEPFADAVPEELDAAAIARTLVTMTSADTGPSLSKYLRGRATLEQFREFAAHRSVYHLREADPHTFAIPRLGGRPKAALIEIQIDEYGGGRGPRMHQEMFRATMTALDLDTTYGAYVGRASALTLATNNLMSLFGLHRRRRGALLGHLAAYEMTSTVPNRAYANGLRRLGGDADATRFYDEHVEADAVHEQIAAYDMCGMFCEQEPELAGDVLFGARCALALDTLWSAEVLSHWERDESSLAAPARGW
jgi:heme oxygenase-like protein